jgi:hypothetical protein
MTFRFYYTGGSITYTGTDLSISPTTGAIKTINYNPFVSARLWIKVISTYASISCSGTASSPAFVIITQCNDYCTPAISNTIYPIYNV